MRNGVAASATAGSGTCADPENMFVGSLPGAGCSEHSFLTPTRHAGVINTGVPTMRLLLPGGAFLDTTAGGKEAQPTHPATNSNGGSTNDKLCHIVVADANRCNTNNLQLGDGNATVRRCSEVNVKRATAHDYSATIPPLENIAYSVTAKVCAKRNLTEIPPVHCSAPIGCT